MPPVDILLERRSFFSDNFQKFVFVFHKCFILQRWTHQDLKTLLLSKLKLTAFPMNPLGFRAFNLLINHADQFCCSRFPLKKKTGVWLIFHFTDDSEHHTWQVQFVCVTVWVILFYRSYKFCWAIVGYVQGGSWKWNVQFYFQHPPLPHHFIFRSVAAPGKTAMLKCCLLVLRSWKIRVPGEKTSLSRKRKQN